MSAFLGPIHHWLYNKIQLQEDLTKELLKDHPDIYERLDHLCGAVERRPLEEVIDTGNIHGWLQIQVLLVENRFAVGITQLRKTESVTWEEIKRKTYAFGSNYPIQASAAPEVFKILQDRLLDGMPCDHVNQLEEQNEQQVSWKQVVDLHGSHWEKAGSQAEMYNELRISFVSGMLKDTGFSIVCSGQQFTIKSK